MTRILATLLLAGLVAFVPALADDPKDTPAKDQPKKEPLKKDDKPIVVPFELLKSRHMALQVKINGKGPYRVIFDTGDPRQQTSSTTRSRRKLASSGKDDKGGLAIFGAAPTPKTIKKLEIGDLVLEGMPTMVMDHPTVAAIAETLGPVEGLIGFPFFARYKMTIDYEKKELTLVPNGYVPGDAMQGLMEKLMNGSKGQKPEPTVVAPAAMWGFTVDKATG